MCSLTPAAGHRALADRAGNRRVQVRHTAGCNLAAVGSPAVGGRDGPGAAAVGSQAADIRPGPSLAEVDTAVGHGAGIAAGSPGCIGRKGRTF